MIPHTLDVRTHVSYNATFVPHWYVKDFLHTSHEKWCSAL